MGRKRREFEQFQDWFIRLYPELAEEIKRKHEMGDDEAFSKLVRTVTFQVTDDCSLACKYCYQINKGKRKMSWDVAKRMVDLLLSGDKGFNEYFIEQPKAIILEFIGGEPLLEIELIDKIVDYFREQAILLNHPWAERFVISICSNGVAYRDKKVQAFLNKNKHIVSFSVTVDGTKELHDSCRVFPDGSPSYDIAHDAAMDWKNKGNDMGSKITLAPSNVMYFSDCLKQMIFDGYYEINANCVYEKGWTVDHAGEIWRQSKEFADWFISSDYDIEEYSISFFNYNHGTPMSPDDDQNWCGGNAAMLSVDPEGLLFPCIRYMESSLGCDRKPIIIGDVWNGLVQRPEEKDIVHCMQCIGRRSQSSDECFYCPVASGCSWCSAYNYQVNGTVDKRATYICEPHKARCLALTYYWNHYYHEKGQNEEVHDLWIPRQWAIPIMGEKDYKDLKELTLKMGGYVNDSEIMIKNYKKKRRWEFKK